MVLGADAKDGAAGTMKKTRKASLKKSPFELSKDQKKMVGRTGSSILASSSSRSKPTTKVTRVQAAAAPQKSKKKKDAKAQLRSVQDERKAKDAKLKALSNRIAWLKAEEEKASQKVGELNNLIQTAQEKDVSAEDVDFRTALTHGREQAARSKLQIKQAAKENKKNLRVVVPKVKRSAKQKKADSSEPTKSKSKSKTKTSAPVSVSASKEKEVEGVIGEDADRAISRVQAKQTELENRSRAAAAVPAEVAAATNTNENENENENESKKKTLTALELISQRWQGNKQPLRENMEITRKQIISHGHKRTTFAPSAPLTDRIRIFEYGAGAWRKHNVIEVTSQS